MADIFQEIDEELRRDRWEVLWQKYGKYLIGCAVAIVAGTAAWVGWQNYQLQQNVSVTNAMHSALAAAQAGQNEQAIEGFAGITKDGNERQVALALLQEAALRARNNDVESARGIYQSVRENSALEAPYRAIATIRSVELDLDTGDAATMLGWLQPLGGDASEWRFAAWELSAYLEKRSGNIAAVKAHLERLRDDRDTPTAARARAEAYLAQL